MNSQTKKLLDISPNEEYSVETVEAFLKSLALSLGAAYREKDIPPHPVVSLVQMHHDKLRNHSNLSQDSLIQFSNLESYFYSLLKAYSETYPINS